MQYTDAVEELARNLFERGDLGVPPNVSRKTFPKVIGGGPRAALWRAINGEDYDAYQRSLAYAAARETPQIFVRKRRAVRKGKPTCFGGVREVGLDEVIFPRNLSAEQFFQLYAAVAYANAVGFVLNAHVTIRWDLLGYTKQDDAARTLVTLTKRLRAWMGERGHEAAWVYAHECSGAAGFHTHLLCAVPPSFTSDFRGWIRESVKTIVRCAQFDKRACHVSCPPSQLVERQWLRFRYLCKSLHPYAYVRSQGAVVFLTDLIDFEYESPGEIRCKKRIGWSCNLGAAERERAGFRSQLDCGVFDIRRLYSGAEYADFLNWQALQRWSISP